MANYSAVSRALYLSLHRWPSSALHVNLPSVLGSLLTLNLVVCRSSRSRYVSTTQPIVSTTWKLSCPSVWRSLLEELRTSQRHLDEVAERVRPLVANLYEGPQMCVRAVAN